MSYADYKKVLNQVKAQQGTSYTNRNTPSAVKGSSGGNKSSGVTGSAGAYMQNKADARSGVFGSLSSSYASYKPTSRITDRMTIGKKKKDEEEKKWYQTGHFEDGWDFGDITKTILGVSEKKTLKTFEAPDTTDSLDLLKQKSDYYKNRTWNNSEQLAEGLKYTQQYNQKALYEYSDKLSKTKMDGRDHTVLEEIEILANMKSGKEKDERKQAVLDKMESLGMDTEFYSHFASDGEFDWGNFGNWIKSGFSAGLNSFNMGVADTADVLLSPILEKIGWEDNPIATTADYYRNAYESNKYAQSLYGEKLGVGNFANSAVEGVSGALPHGILALLTAGQSLGSTGSNLATKAAYAAGNFLTKAGITAETMMKNPQFWTSFARTLGSDFKEAKENGVSDAAAAVGSVLKSTINAGIEIGLDGGSGIQGLPGDLLEEGGSKFWKWTESWLEEGGEEILQKFVGETIDKVGYGSDKEMLNPIEYAKEGLLGMVAGAALGGGQVANQSVNEALYNRNAKKTEVEAPFVEDVKPEVEEPEIVPVKEQPEVVTENEIATEEKPKRVLYTGSANTDIKQFKVGGVDGSKQTGDRYGRGIYLTTNESTAKNYAGENGRVYQTNVDDLNIFNLNDKITPEMKENLVSDLRDTDPQYRNSVLRNFRSEQVFEDFKSAEAFFNQQREVWKEQDGMYDANKPEIKTADHETGKAVIEYTDFANWENVIGDLTGSQLYDALKSLSTDGFSSFITANGFDGISFDEDVDNQQYVIYRNEDRIKIDEPFAENSTIEQETQLSEENSTVSEMENITPVAESPLVEAENVVPEQKSDTKSKYVPKTVKATPAQSVFKSRALDVEALPNSQKEKIKGKYKALEHASDVATDLLMNGTDTLRPVHEIFEDISKVGDVDDFNSYIYHKLNPERIAQDKDVHRGVPAEMSREYVKHLAENNPEFEKYAQEIYAWCDYLLNLQVESNQLTQEKADKFKSMYPSYAPIRRDGFPDDMRIMDYLGLLFENQGSVLDTDYASEVLGAIENTDPLKKKTTGGENPILPLADTLAERIIQIHWQAALHSDMFDVADAKTSSKPEHALYVDDVLEFVDNFENPFTESDFTFEKRNDHHMRKLFSKEELAKLTNETNELIALYLNSIDDADFPPALRKTFLTNLTKDPEEVISLFGKFRPADRARLNENYVLHDLQVIRSKLDNFGKWLDRINGELTYLRDDLSTLKQKINDLGRSHIQSEGVYPISSVTDLLREYNEKKIELEKQIRKKEISLKNATAYVNQESGFLRELDRVYVGMLLMKKPNQQGGNFSSGTTFVDSNTQETAQVQPEPFVEEAVVDEAPAVKYDEPKFTNPKDAKFDFDGNDKKLSRTTMLMEHGVDKGAVFEKLGRETKNDELAAKWDFIRKTYNSTQHMIGKGVDGINSINNIFTEVDNLGVAEEFQDYLRLMAHWDGMTVKMRYGFPKNRAFLNTDVEAYKAKDQAKELEKKYPTFAKLADDVYQNMAHLRAEMVDAGLMTQKDADFIAEVYPHFVPVRYNQDGTAVPVFDSIATQMMNVKSACATNKFSGELLGTLNSAVPIEGIDSYDILSRFAGSSKLFELGEFGNYPTYTFYDNGKKVNYAVSIQMQEALKKSHPGLSARIPLLAWANDAFRAVTTEYNIPFHATNLIRDTKDVLINSQHAAETYKNYPRAIKELITKGSYYQEYLENGGGSNTYFDTKKRVFTSSKKTLSDFPPIALISKAGNFIESIPRLSEYIASREMGKSVEKSMLDASHVTTNFGAGGDVTKFIDRNGCTFLNASVQGFAQNVRNFQEAKQRGLMGYGVLAAKLMLLGLPNAILDMIIWDDDEDYQNLPDYIKEGYNIVWKTNSGRFVRFPKSRVQACVDNAFDQIWDVMTGDDEIDLMEFGRIFVANLAPNNPLDDNLTAPIRQVINNKAWYGDDLVPTRLQKLPESEQFDDKTDALSRYLGETFDYSPYKINYLLNSYGGGLADVILPFATPRAESGDDSVLGKLLNPFRDKFTTDPVLNNRVTDDFYAKVDELQTVANSADATEKDKLIASYMLSESSEISDLWDKRREIQSSDLPDSTKFEQMRQVKEEINNRMFSAMESYENVNITGRYATIDGHRFNKDDSGKWWELKPKKADGTDNGYYTNEQEHLKVLGITPEEYWNNQEYYHEQYNMAIYRPGEYALTEVFGGYDEYLSITDDWSDLVTGKNDMGQWNTTVNKKTVGNIVYDLDIPEIEKHILYKSIYNYTDSHNREILEYLDSRNDITWDEMKKIVIELGFTVDQNDRIHW